QPSHLRNVRIGHGAAVAHTACYMQLCVRQRNRNILKKHQPHAKAQHNGRRRYFHPEPHRAVLLFGRSEHHNSLPPHSAEKRFAPHVLTTYHKPMLSTSASRAKTVQNPAKPSALPNSTQASAPRPTSPMPPKMPQKAEADCFTTSVSFTPSSLGSSR